MAVEHVEEAAQVDRLRQVGGGACGQQLLALPRCVGAQNDHRDVTRLGVLLQLGQNSVARNVRQVEVEQDQVGMMLAGELNAESPEHR